MFQGPGIRASSVVWFTATSNPVSTRHVYIAVQLPHWLDCVRPCSWSHQMHQMSIFDGSTQQPLQAAQSRLNQAGSQTQERHRESGQFRFFFFFFKLKRLWGRYSPTKSQILKENFGQFNHAASLLKLPLACQYRRREHIWSNHYRAPWTES